MPEFEIYLEVLILVLMEDALRALHAFPNRRCNRQVLILVLMEDALRDLFLLHNRKTDNVVLILVLMEDALRVSMLNTIFDLAMVLILVLMEDALRELILRRIDCQLVTALFSRNPLDFRGKSVPNCLQIYEFPRLCLTLSERSHE